MITEVLLGKGIVALCQMQVAQCLRQTVGTSRLGNQVLGSLRVACLQGHQSQVCTGFCHIASLCEILFSLLFLTLLHCQYPEVVVYSAVLGIETGSFLQDILFLRICCSNRGSIDQFLHAQLRGILLILLENLVVITSYHFVVDGHAGASQLRQHALCQFAEALTQVFDLLFTLLWVLIHGQHAQDDVLVGDIAGLYQFLKSLPVLSSIFRTDTAFQLGILHLLANVALRVLLTLIGQFLVQLHTTVGRCIG